ncbi:selenocysteine-specific translation elongation factor [Knoellia sp. CPCC 206453]|uniref:selenocysteine-specific translation elongation factor n=1 Tax=Knoellia pratensis TaxID=3404796 RepID=UPI00361B2B37
MLVIATAGHVDHGKSTLLRALTGTDPDRLAEEKRRGLTIDLGFAWTALPGGGAVAFVDVPGHVDFTTTMLAGVAPASAVMLVVAADEGWRAQSEEHLLALEALGTTHGLVVITKADLADPSSVLESVRERLRGTCLAREDVQVVSAQSGDGLGSLLAALQRLSEDIPPPTESRTRLWVDRAFVIRGAGTVLTGTLASGQVSVGDVLDVADASVTVRRLESLGQQVEHVGAPGRVAVNVRDLPVSAVRRGDTLTGPGWIPSLTIDTTVPPMDLPQSATLHVGSAAHEVRIRPLDEGFARLTLPTPLPLTRGDRAVLRASGTRHVLGGVRVLDVDPPPLVRRGSARRRAAALATDLTPDDPVAEILRREVVSHLDLQRLGFGTPASNDGRVVSIDRWYLSGEVMTRWRSVLVERLLDPHRDLQDPDPTELAVVRDLGLPSPRVLAAVLESTGLTVRGGRVTRVELPRDLGPHEAAVAALENRLANDPFGAMTKPDLAATELGPAGLKGAERAGRLILLDDEVVLLPTALPSALERLAALPQPFTTSEARQALGASRRVALSLLRRLDHDGGTQRLPDDRRMVSGRQP